MKYEAPVVIICNGNANANNSAKDDSTSCALSLGCCVLTLYKK